MKTSEKGFTLVELLVVIGILGILMGALFPAISSAMLSANTSAMSMRGRNLFMAITQCNTDREAAGLVKVWPKTAGQDSGLDSDEQQLINAPTSTEYFKYLFDVENKGNAANWKPYVDVDIGVLSGGGVPGVSGTQIQQDNVAWLITKDMTDEMPDVIPALVTRNVDYQTLGGKIAGSITGTEPEEIFCGNGRGARDTPFGNKAWIMITKGGAAKVIKAKYSKVSAIFNRQGFDNSKANPAPTISEL